MSAIAWSVLAALGLGLTLSGSVKDDDSRPSFDVDSRLGEESVEIQLEIHHPGAEAEHWLGQPPGGGLPGDVSWPHNGATNGEAGGGEDGRPAPDGGPSPHYCIGAAVGADPDCLGFMASLPQLGRMTGCLIGQQIAGIQSEPGTAPHEMCLDDLPEPEVEQALIEESVADAESQWEQILIQIPGEVEQTFATLPIDGGQVSFEEELLGFGYVNRHTNVFVDTEPQTFTETLLGVQVEVRAIPVEHLFDYGDGTLRALHDSGGPASDLGDLGDNATLADIETPTSHVYQDTGVYPVEVTTTFIGEYRLPGGAWMPISGTTDVPASPGEADIWRIDHRHVSEECRQPDHWGCSGPVELKPGDQPPTIFADHYD